jgi:hypothetical protein
LRFISTFLAILFTLHPLAVAAAEPDRPLVWCAYSAGAVLSKNTDDGRRSSSTVFEAPVGVRTQDPIRTAPTRNWWQNNRKWVIPLVVAAAGAGMWLSTRGGGGNDKTVGGPPSNGGG